VLSLRRLETIQRKRVKGPKSQGMTVDDHQDRLIAHKR
jgi:hypothetical protein